VTLLLSLCLSALPASAFDHPGGITSSSRIQAVRKNLGREPWRSAFAQLRSEALAALDYKTDAPETLRVPGYYSDAAGHTSGKKSLSDAALAAYALALAYQIGQDPRFADKAAAILDDWAAKNKKVQGPDGDLVLCYAGIPFLFAAELLHGYDGWDRTAFQTWVRGVFLKSARKLERRSNNQGAWGIFAAMAGHHLLDEKEALLADIPRLRARIESRIAQDGSLPLESRRTNSGMWYTYFALAPLTSAAAITLDATGEDLFHDTALKRGLDKLFTYCLDPGSWPHPKPGGIYGWFHNKLYPSEDRVDRPSPTDWPANLYEAMLPVYREPRWEAWLAPHRPIRGGRAWIYPTLLILLDSP